MVKKGVAKQMTNSVPSTPSRHNNQERKDWGMASSMVNMSFRTSAGGVSLYWNVKLPAVLLWNTDFYFCLLVKQENTVINLFFCSKSEIKPQHYLCKAVDHSSDGCRVKEKHGHSQDVVEQPWMQDLRRVNRSFGKNQCAEEHKDTCNKRRGLTF